MSLWKAWVELLSRREPATALAWFRILLGATVCGALWSVHRADLVSVLWCDAAQGGYRALDGGAHFQLLRALVPESVPECDVVSAAFWTTVAASALMTVGLGGRVSVAFTAFGWLAVVDRNGHVGGSYDELISNGLWLLVLAPSTATWSADCWIRTGRPTCGTPVSAWVRYLAVFQLVLMYGATGLQKVSAHWTPGGDLSALYYILQQPTWQWRDMEWVAAFYPVTQVATAVTWFWEVLAPLWLLGFWFELTARTAVGGAVPQTREGRCRRAFSTMRVTLVFALLGITFHVAVTMLMNIGPFSWASLAYYPCLLHPWTIDRLRGLPR